MPQSYARETATGSAQDPKTDPGFCWFAGLWCRFRECREPGRDHNGGAGLDAEARRRGYGDAVEAEAWAYLAVRSLKGLPITFPGTTGVAAPLTGGVLARAAAY